MSSDPRVSFLIAGVQKGGTSALFEYLRAMPGVQMPAIKEAHHFDDETLDWARTDHASYHGLFADDDRLRGEATPIYIYWPNSLARIARYNPAMRIILLFRDPIERAWSHWKMEYAKGKERMPFAWCIREGRARLANGDPSAPGHHRVFSYVERGFYAGQVEQLFGLLPREQCLLLRSEDLHVDPNRQLATVCRFLDLPPPDMVAPQNVHAARDMAYPSQLRPEDRTLLAAHYRPEMARFEEATNIDVSFWTQNWP